MYSDGDAKVNKAGGVSVLMELSDKKTVAVTRNSPRSGYCGSTS